MDACGELNAAHAVGPPPEQGFAALKTRNVLPQFKGVVVHDTWSPLFKISAQHALYGAHLLRELRGLTVMLGQVWV
ncbi:hypothetical protein GCM10022631_24500 [Deinococcus rubellus]